jgi:hypothetical protein
MLPTATGSLPGTAATYPVPTTNTNTNTCSDATANTYEQMGFQVNYDVPSSASGNLLVDLAFEVQTAASSGASSVWQASWGTGVAPTCHTQETGITIGQSFTVMSQASNVGGVAQSETIVIPDVQRVAGTSIWIDVQAYDSSASTWIYSDPSIAVVMFPE